MVFWKVLIADDDRATLSLLHQVFQKEGFRVFLAQNVDEAKRIIKRKAPDCALLDYRFENGSALDICKFIKQNAETSNIPIAILSGYGGEKIKCYKACADLFIEKENSVQEVLEAFKSLIRRVQWERGIFNVEGITLDYRLHRVSVKGMKPVELSKEQFLCFAILVRNSPDYVSAKVLGREIFGDRSFRTGARKMILCRMKKKIVNSIGGEVKNYRKKGWAYLPPTREKNKTNFS